MKVVVNGQEREVPDACTLRGLIELVGLGADACAAEVNTRFVPRREHQTQALREGDRIELVSLVGGG